MQVFGLMTKPLVRLLLPSPKPFSSMISSEPSSPKYLVVPLIGNGEETETDQASQNVPRPTSLRMLLSTPSHTVHHYWRKFDDSFMRPVFGGRGFTPFIPGSPTEPNLGQWRWEGNQQILNNGNENETKAKIHTLITRLVARACNRLSVWILSIFERFQSGIVTICL